jgi:hypothetical protein
MKKITIKGSVKGKRVPSRVLKKRYRKLLEMVQGTFK